MQQIRKTVIALWRMFWWEELAFQPAYNREVDPALLYRHGLKRQRLSR